MFRSSLFSAVAGILVCSVLSGVIYYTFAERLSIVEPWVHSEIDYSDWSFYLILAFTVVSYLFPIIHLRKLRRATYLTVGFTILLTLVIYTNLVWVAWVAHFQGGAASNDFGSIYHVLLVLLTGYSLFSLSDRYLFRAPWWMMMLLIPILYFINSPFTPAYLSFWLPLSFGLLSLFMTTHSQPAFSADREDILDDMG